MIDAAVVLVLLAGEVIATIGAPPRLTVTAALPLPKALVHATVIVFAPETSAAELVAVLVDAVPLTVHVVPDGIVVVALTVYATLTGLLVTLALLAGDVIATTGALPRLTMIDTGVLVPNELAQDTEIVFAPKTSATELVVAVVEAAPLTVQVVPDGIVVAPLTV